MEVVAAILGAVTGVVGAITGIIAAFSRTDRLLGEIRDVLIQIRDNNAS
jgi:hypothetical protein